MIINFVRNGEECNLYNTVWCAGGMQVVDVGTNNVREEEFNHVLGYAMARLYNLQITCKNFVMGYSRF